MPSFAKPGVVGHRGVAHAARHDRRVVHDGAGRVLVDVEPLDVIRLVEVQIRVVERRDRPGVVEERARVAVVVAERPPVDRVRLGVGVVVDLDVVADVLAEREEVRPSRWGLERDPVADDRDRAGIVRADERIEVRVVGLRVGGDQRRLAVARCATGGRAETGEEPDPDRGRGAEHHESRACSERLHVPSSVVRGVAWRERPRAAMPPFLVAWARSYGQGSQSSSGRITRSSLDRLLASGHVREARLPTRALRAAGRGRVPRVRVGGPAVLLGLARLLREAAVGDR